MRIMMAATPESAREALDTLIKTRGVGYASMSRLLGRNAAYIQQYVKRGTPKFLEEEDRERLAAYFGVDPSTLGGPASAANGNTVELKKLDVRPSAGAGSDPSQDDAILTHFTFDRRWLRQHGQGNPERLSLVTVSGDSMTPTLQDGDEILVAPLEGGRPIRDGVYVLERDGELMVKRLAVNPATSLLTIASDNTTYPTWRECKASDVRLVGRVIWSGRWLG